MKRGLLTYAILLFTLITHGQDEIWMRPNKGQWHPNVSYKIEIPGGQMFLETDGFTYSFNNLGDHYEHAHEDNLEERLENPVHGHAVKVKFLNANPTVTFKELNPSRFYENYLYGQDTSKWVKKSRAYTEIDYVELYDSIDMRVYEANNSLKYDLIVKPGAELNDLRIRYDGQTDLSIVNEELVITTPLGTVTEGKPSVYQYIAGVKVKVDCYYTLEDNIMSFTFPFGYDTESTLYIDPALTFSTFTGSTADNWGMTACPDSDKQLIAGGIVFGTGYPTSPGAFDDTYDDDFDPFTRVIDIGLTKFNASGTDIVFSTYIGGEGSETPHSLIVNDANELYIMGATSSSDFPIGPSPYQGTFAGGTALSDVDGIDFTVGTDIFVLKLSPDGSTLLGGTYIGGSANDGISEAGVAPGTFTIAYNYGDQLRGEIMVDDASNVYVSSTTRSSDFPIEGGFDATLNGAQDAVIFKLNSNLNNLLWSTYLGGSGLETGNSVQLSSTGDIFIAGGTTSADMPNMDGGLHSSYHGGSVDGYLMRFPAPLYDAPNGTFLGTAEYDQAYMVQLDPDDNVYAYGNSNGDYEILGGVYENPGSGQFIHKLSNDLSTSIWSTVFGAGTGISEISPTAFLVSDCYEIYIAGWGGTINNSLDTPASGSTTLGFPVTPDAYQATTSGSNFYLAVFTADMAALKYATFMGNTDFLRDHVDGGTSRFDKSGSIYHAVCAACGGVDSGFPTTPGAYSPTNPAANCNMAAFQFDLAKIEAVLSTGEPVICIPDPVTFDNASENGDTYFWDFGDGVGTSDEFEPTYFYETPGDYTVMLIVTDSEGCFLPDTAYIDVTIALFEGEAGSLEDTICPGTTVQLFAIGGDTYSWGPADLFEDPSLAEPIVTITEATTFTVTIESICGTSEVDVTVEVYDIDAFAGPDTAICIGGTAELFASGGQSYSWSPPDEVDDPTAETTSASPSITKYFSVVITTEEGCIVEDSTRVFVDLGLPFPTVTGPNKICLGDTTRITAGGASSYSWLPDYNISDVNLYNPLVWPAVDTTYKVSFTNACGTVYDSIFIEVVEVIGDISPDTTICPGDTVSLWATGGVEYKWTPRSFLSTPNNASTIAFPAYDITYEVRITDEIGCTTSLSTIVSLFESPRIEVSPEIYAILGDTIPIWAEAEGSITWSPPYNIGCITCTETYVFLSMKRITRLQ
jgi:PKD repeat protein